MQLSVVAPECQSLMAVVETVHRGDDADDVPVVDALQFFFRTSASLLRQIFKRMSCMLCFEFGYAAYIVGILQTRIFCGVTAHVVNVRAPHLCEFCGKLHLHDVAPSFVVVNPE